MKTVATFSKPEDAHLLRMRLESAGIAAFVQHENFAQLGAHYSLAMGGVRVEVAEEDLAAAAELIADRAG